jgi:DNA-binding transcriptional regulator YhcF (GntR family)
MQIDIDPTSPSPLYQQLRDRVVEAIAAGRLRPGDGLASVRQLAVAFGINVATVAKGYDMLRAEGLIRTNRKSGSVVARGPESGAADERFAPEWTERARTLLAEATAQGLTRDEVLAVAGGILDDFAAERIAPPAPASDRKEQP